VLYSVVQLLVCCCYFHAHDAHLLPCYVDLLFLPIALCGLRCAVLHLFYDRYHYILFCYLLLDGNLVFIVAVPAMIHLPVTTLPPAVITMPTHIVCYYIVIYYHSYPIYDLFLVYVCTFPYHYPWPTLPSFTLAIPSLVHLLLPIYLPFIFTDFPTPLHY